jgi:chromosome segregation ATPase
MNLISREEYNRINEAVLGLRRLATYEDLQKVNDEEFNEMVKFLLLISNQTDARLCESHYNLVKELMVNNGLVEESRFDSFDQTLSLNENYLNETWDDDLSKGIETGAKVVGGAAIAGAVSLASYISFLFKKKKIRKAWEAVRDKRLEKVQVDTDLADTIRSFEPELSKEEVTDKVSEIEAKKEEKKKELEDFDANNEKEIEKLETQKEDIDSKLKELDPTDGASEKEPTEKTPKEEKTEESLQEAEEKGKLQIAQDKVKELTPNKDQVKKDTEALQDQIKKIEEERAKLKKDQPDGWKKKDEKLGNKKNSLQGELKELEEGSPEKQKAQEEVNKIKDEIEKLKGEKSKVKDDISKAKDVEAQKAEKEKIKDEISGIDDEVKEIKEKGKPRGTEKEKKQAIEDATKEKEQIDAEVQKATDDADRISGTSGGGESSSSVGGKIFGFSKGYVQKLKAEHETEVLKAKRDALTVNDTLSDKDKAKQEKALDAQEADAKERMKQGEESEKSAKDKVDASDKDIKAAEKGVEDKQAEIDAKEAEDKKKEVADKKEAIDSEIDRINQKIEGAKEALKSGKVPDSKKESVESNIKAFNDKKAELRKMKDKLGESAYYKFTLAVLERDIDNLLNEYNIIVETRKELLEEKPSDKKGDDSGKAKEDKGNSLEGKKVVLQDMRDKDMGQLDGAKGEIVKVFKENEREPEGDLPMRSGDPQMYKIKLDDPKDPMYPDINLTDKNFKVIEEEPKKEEPKKDDANESFRSKFYKAYNDTNKQI